nr:DEAD/DEAH box helicase [Desulfobacteraceae bacterium]
MNRMAEYIHALIHSEHFRSQVAAHHILQGQEAQVRPVRGFLAPSEAELLQRIGFDSLYTHQAEAVEAIAAGEHTVVATPTASGKTLIYNLPLFQAMARDSQARALYIFPLKALAQDQLATFSQWAERAVSASPTAAIYDGDTNAYQRKKIRLQPPNVLFTNPEMVHMSLLAYHDRWQAFFRHLRLVVIDEVHTYRGMLGSHMAQVLRRLRRVSAFYNAAPTFVFTSATVANPGHLAGLLTGLEVHTIRESGAPRGERHVVLIDPQDGGAQAAIGLLKAALVRQLRTIVYTQSRKLAELIAIWAQQRAGQWSSRISVYRAGLLPQDRRHIEQRLKSGELLAVISTSALELGIDIGDLDLCILVGYPGSMISTWQRGGRVGRQGQSSALIFLAAENALDKYFIAHPQAFWQGEAETAVIHPWNSKALEAHLECAAAELPLQRDEAMMAKAEVTQAANRLLHNGVLRASADGLTLFARSRRPHLSVHLRSTGERYRIVDSATNSTIGEIDTHRLYHETHPGAVYLHQGNSYVAEDINLKQRCVH